MAESKTKKGGGLDLLGDSSLLANFLGQTLGNATSELTRRNYDVPDQQDLPQVIGDVFKQEFNLKAAGTNAVAALLLTGVTKFGDTHGWSPGTSLILRDVLEDAFDGLRRASASGRVTPTDAKKVMDDALGKMTHRLDHEMSFDWALQFLKSDQQIEFGKRLAQLKSDPDDGFEWEALWERKLNKVGLLHPLLQIPGERWAKHLEQLFGRSRKKGAKKSQGFLARFAPQGILALFTGDSATSQRIKEDAAKFEAKAGTDAQDARRRRVNLNKAYYGNKR